jgi:hypothetical protein
MPGPTTSPDDLSTASSQAWPALPGAHSPTGAKSAAAGRALANNPTATQTPKNKLKVRTSNSFREPST